MATRRGFLGMLAGVATATTFATRFPMFPRAEAAPALIARPQYDVWVGLMRAGQHEVRSRDYVRVAPDLLEVVEDGRVTVLATFPTVTHRGYLARGLGLFNKGGDLLFWQDFPSAVQLMCGNTLQVNGDFRFDGGISKAAIEQLLGIKRLAA